MEVLFDLIFYPSKKDDINLINKEISNLILDKNIIDIIIDDSCITLRTDEYLKIIFILSLISKHKELTSSLNCDYSVLQITSFEADFFNNVNYEIHSDLISLLYLLKINLNFTYAIKPS